MSPTPKALLPTHCNQTATTLGFVPFGKTSSIGKSYIEFVKSYIE
jgi:hypothetical protein